MNDLDRQAHWQSVYATKPERELSRFQEDPAPSLDLIAEPLSRPTRASLTSEAAPHAWWIVCWSGV